MLPPEIRRERRELSVVVVLSLIAVVACLLFLMIVTGWGFLWMFGATAGFIVLGVLHYLVWGKAEERSMQHAGPRIPSDDPDQPWPGGGSAAH